MIRRYLVIASVLLVLPAAFSCGGQAADTTATYTAKTEGDGTIGVFDPATVSVVPAFSRLSFRSPVFLTCVTGEGSRLAVVEQDGRIVTFDGDDSAGETEVLLDISDRVNSGGEEGLLGLVFDARFAENGIYYVYYSAADPRRTILSRFIYPDNQEMVLLEVAQPYSNHNGGTIAFGPDGYLYIGLGDGGSGGDPAGNGQDPSTLLGSIIRIDVNNAAPSANGESYGIPPDNPFADSPDGRGEVWAYGFRNPYRFSFDSSTGDLWAGDVGQSTREEIDLVVPGGNYGWNIFEGSLPYDNPSDLPASSFREPVVDYGRDQGLSVIGGYVYRGTAFPTLNGIFFYGDYGSGTIWALDYTDGEVVLNEPVGEVPAISSFGEGCDGQVYVVSLEGRIYRLEGE